MHPTFLKCNPLASKLVSAKFCAPTQVHPTDISLVDLSKLHSPRLISCRPFGFEFWENLGVQNVPRIFGEKLFPRLLVLPNNDAQINNFVWPFLLPIRVDKVVVVVGMPLSFLPKIVLFSHPHSSVASTKTKWVCVCLCARVKEHTICTNSIHGRK